jgi:deoxyuridine 5'-triphosphate nucleotidohydrolase
VNDLRAKAYEHGLDAARSASLSGAPREILDSDFARGVFDALGALTVNATDQLCCRLDLEPLPELLEGFAERFRGTRGDAKSTELEWHGHEALDFLAMLYDEAERFDAEKRKLYLSWASRVPTADPSASNPELEWCALRPDAVAPKKERASDSGYDLTLLEKVDQLGDVELYGTGLTVRPPSGYYFDVVPRSSIIKRGYLLANSVGVIDRGYRGEIKVPLVRVSARTMPLELPARVVQLIPRAIVHFPVRRRDSLDETGRGVGGFGSTGR